jgi:hypothetical protein
LIFLLINFQIILIIFQYAALTQGFCFVSIIFISFDLIFLCPNDSKYGGEAAEAGGQKADKVRSDACNRETLERNVQH